MSRIINLRGTSGSGKSTIVRRLLELYPRHVTEAWSDRKQPIGYLYHRTQNADHICVKGLCAICHANPSLYVIGHYETDCGGADTVSRFLKCPDGELRGGLDLIYWLVEDAAKKDYDVIFEGLVVASDWRRCVDLKNRHQLLVIGLNTSLEECERSVMARRTASAERKGREVEEVKMDKHGHQKNTYAKYKALISQRKYFKDNNVDFRVLSRESAYQACVDYLGLRSPEASPVPPVG